MLSDFSSGTTPLVNVTRVINGWIVTVHQSNRDREVSPETAAKREAEIAAARVAQKEQDKQRIIRDMKVQLANMAIVGKAAGKAQRRAIEETEEWKSDNEEADEEENTVEKEIEAMAARIVEESSASAQSTSTLGRGFFGFLDAVSPVETHIFTDRQKMMDFVTEMLKPIVE